MEALCSSGVRHIVNPKMLVYLAEAIRIPRDQIEQAIAAALKGRTMMAMSGAIRKIIPWEVVEPALLQAARAR